MSPTPYATYLEDQVLSADGLELVRILYQNAILSVRSARAYLTAGDIAQRSAAISKAMQILAELNCSLDSERGGDLSRNLAELYDYMQHRLIFANVHQSDEPLAEVERLLMTLAAAWDGIKRSDPCECPQPKDEPTPLPRETDAADSWVWIRETGMESMASTSSRVFSA